MSLRAAILAALAILGFALLGIWQLAPSVVIKARGLMDGERVEMLVARAGIWGPAVIVTLMTVAVVATPIALIAGAGRDRRRAWRADCVWPCADSRARCLATGFR